MTPEEEKKVLAMLEDYERIGWLWRGVAKLAKWVAAVAAATAALAVTYKTIVGK